MMKHPDISNNGGTHCCKSCKLKENTHGFMCPSNTIARPLNNVKSPFTTMMAALELRRHKGINADIRELEKFIWNLMPPGNLIDNFTENFYIAIPTIKNYKAALDMLLESIPREFIKRTIVIYQKEDENKYTICSDGRIEVCVKNNIYEYGSWVGVNLLLEQNIISKKAWFVFLHDTTKMGPETMNRLHVLYNKYAESDIDILWLSLRGQANLCLINSKGVIAGNEIYKNYLIMDKIEAIGGEWNTNDISPKRLDVKQVYYPSLPIHIGSRAVYGDIKREVVCFSAIDLEKYFYYVDPVKLWHPQNP